ncbi:hypothetical protein PoB_003866700 [Plakobranchus ocellatus]|uniref:Uncharacterized protein n=1 Tax=Plakobranchus ocellatus TaxID=259542 RepID=A0AAV4AYP2_9GAST|nr:hypothetical protein PoB_003866700 [Plakobranchus ocellatus]
MLIETGDFSQCLILIVNSNPVVAGEYSMFNAPTVCEYTPAGIKWTNAVDLGICYLGQKVNFSLVGRKQLRSNRILTEYRGRLIIIKGERPFPLLPN